MRAKQTDIAKLFSAVEMAFDNLRYRVEELENEVRTVVRFSPRHLGEINQLILRIQKIESSLPSTFNVLDAFSDIYDRIRKLEGNRT